MYICGSSIAPEILNLIIDWVKDGPATLFPLLLVCRAMKEISGADALWRLIAYSTNWAKRQFLLLDPELKSPIRCRIGKALKEETREGRFVRWAQLGPVVSASLSERLDAGSSDRAARSLLSLWDLLLFNPSDLSIPARDTPNAFQIIHNMVYELAIYGYTLCMYKLIIRLYTDALVKCRTLPDALVSAPVPGTRGTQKFPPTLQEAYNLAHSITTGNDPSGTQHIPFRRVALLESWTLDDDDIRPLPARMMNRMEHFRLYACTVMFFFLYFRRIADECGLVDGLPMNELAQRVWDGEDIPQTKMMRRSWE
jgi:hypothetical protein